MPTLVDISYCYDFLNYLKSDNNPVRCSALWNTSLTGLLNEFEKWDTESLCTDMGYSVLTTFLSSSKSEHALFRLGLTVR